MSLSYIFIYFSLRGDLIFIVFFIYIVYETIFMK